MTIKKLFLFILCFAFLVVPAYATDYFPCTSLTGGGTGALDAIDGSGLESGDVAIVTTSSAAYVYRMNATSGAAESSPDTISPDSNAGDKRWILAGVYGATFQAASGTSINEFSIDDTLAGDSDDAVPTEQAVKAYIDNEISGVAAISNFAGYVGRSKFEYKDTDEIYLNPGRYEHNGTSQQMVSWNSQLTFQFGAGGSNADSSALAASDWFYLYVDDSAVVTLGAALLTASEFVAVTTEPTYSVTKHGWYNGSDRCIAAFRTNASSQIAEFWHDGGGVLHYAADIEDRADSDLDSSWEDVTLTIPDFGAYAAALVTIHASQDNDATWLSWRTNGSAADGHEVLYAAGSNNHPVQTLKVFVDSSQKIEIKYSTNNANTAQVWTNGYYFPRGM